MRIIRLFPVLLAIMLITSFSSATVHLPPQITDSPDDLIYQVGTSGHTISWTAEAQESGDEPGTYIVTRNGTALSDHNEVNWEDNVPIVVNVTGLELGTYEFEIEVRDSGFPDKADANTDAVLVTVVESTANQNPTSDSDDASYQLFGFVFILMIPILKKFSKYSL